MEARINFLEKGQGIFKALGPIAGYLSKSTLEQNLLHLIYFRVSQINGCAYCLDMHSKDLRAAGETEQRLYVMNAWRETALFSPKEQAALALAESVTNIQEGVSDEVFEQAKAAFTEDEILTLILAITTINTYNRLNVALKVQGGDYQVGQFNG